MNGAIRLFVGTKRGLFILTGDAQRRVWTVSPPMLPGREIYFAGADPRDGTIRVASAHRVWGPHIHVSRDGGASWELLENAPRLDGGGNIDAVWSIAPGPDGTLLAGTEPAALFSSPDRGVSWTPVEALNRHPTTATWQPAGGSLALHSIALAPDGRTVYCAVSAGGAYRSDDAGETWQPINRGVRADFLPDHFPEAGHCVHRLLVHPSSGRLWQQNHCGVYRSDDRGNQWIDVTAGLPSGYGYALALDPTDPDRAFVIPEESSHMRTTIGGRLRVYRTRDAGGSWQALTRGLPQQNAYVSVLRECMTTDSMDPCGVYFGTSSGHVFGSSNTGESWRVLAEYLPRVVCVAAVII